MNADHVFIAERVAATHCPQLFSQGADHAELQPLLGRVGERLARRLAGALAPLLGGEAPLVRCSAVREASMATLRDGAAHPLAANSLFAVGPIQAPLLVTIDAAAVFRIVDRAFGGKGIAPRPLPDVFPMAAELMIARLETMVAAQITGALDAVTEGIAAMSGTRAIEPQRRDGQLTQLAPFAQDAVLAILVLEVKEEDGAPWSLTLALPVTSLPALFGLASAAPPTVRPPVRPQDRAHTAPFGDLPLTLRAQIVDMVLPFATVAALVPGQILPVTVARIVPLQVNDRAIAQGTIGAVDDCVAIQITTAFTA